MAELVLVAEDNPEAGRILEGALRSEGYEVVLTESAERACRVFEQRPCALVVLDIVLKEGSGHDVCRRIRAHPSRSGVPILMLTAQDGPQDKARGFASGTDCYLAKPIEQGEFLGWVRALMRRARRDWSEAAVIRAGELAIHPEARMVEVRGQLVRGLTAREFDLLHELARARPRVLKRDELLSKLGGGEGSGGALDVHISNLRRKLGPLGASHVVTVKGVGFQLA